MPTWWKPHKREIESKGFHQIITEITRTWPGVEDSLIDHVWLNIPEKVVNKMNIIDAESDHNIIGITLRIKGMMANNLEFNKRQWSNFDQNNYVQKVEKIDWESMYSLENVDLIWDYFETNLNSVINEVAPIVKVQPKGGYRNWVTNETKALMHERNSLRTQASRTGSTELWNKYRTARNKVTAEVQKDRKNYFKKQYDECDAKNDSKKLYSTVKKQLGWNKN